MMKLIEIIHGRKLSLVQQALNENASITEKDALGRTPIQVAADLGFWDAVLSIAASRKETFLRSANYSAALLTAARHDKLEVVKQLIKSGAAVTSVEPQTKSTALHYAAANDNVEMVEFLIQERAKCSATDINGATPIVVAAENQNWNAVRAIVKAKPESESKDRGYGRAAVLAAFHSRWDELSILIAAGADHTSRHPLNEYTLLHFLAKSNQLRIAKTMRLGREHTTALAINQTPIQVAAANNNWEFVLHLARSVCEQRRSTNDYMPCPLSRYGEVLLSAAEQQMWHVMPRLALNAANLNVLTSHNDTVLHLAASDGQITVVDYLLKNMVKRSLLNKDNKQAIHLAVDNGHWQVACNIARHAARSHNNVAQDLVISPDSGVDSGYAFLQAMKQGKFAVACQLIRETELDYDYKDKITGDTAMHQAARDIKIRRVAFLLTNRASLSIKNKQGQTPSQIPGFTALSFISLFWCLQDNRASIFTRRLIAENAHFKRLLELIYTPNVLPHQITALIKDELRTPRDLNGQYLMLLDEVVRIESAAQLKQALVFFTLMLRDDYSESTDTAEFARSCLIMHALQLVVTMQLRRRRRKMMSTKII